MRSPKIEPVTVTAVLKFRSYPSFSMVGIMKVPIAEVAATAEPEIEPKSIQDSVFTSARPPGNVPTRALAASINRFAIPPRPIKYPEITKKGIASSVKLSSPPANLCAIVVMAGSKDMLSINVEAEAKPILTAIDTPIITRMKNTPNRTRMDSNMAYCPSLMGLAISDGSTSLGLCIFPLRIPSEI